MTHGPGALVGEGTVEWDRLALGRRGRVGVGYGKLAAQGEGQERKSISEFLKMLTV